MDITNFATAMPIVVICYAIGVMCKSVEKINNKWIPIIVISVGAVLGIPSMYLMQDFPANDIITALAVGCASGLAAVGLNQVYKQSKKEEK